MADPQDIQKGFTKLTKLLPKKVRKVTSQGFELKMSCLVLWPSPFSTCEKTSFLDYLTLPLSRLSRIPHLYQEPIQCFCQTH